MKNLGLLFVGAFLLASCDATPGGNKAIYPVTHDEPVEKVDEHAGHDHSAHGHATESAEVADTLTTATSTETVVETPKDSAQ